MGRGRIEAAEFPSREELVLKNCPSRSAVRRFSGSFVRFTEEEMGNSIGGRTIAVLAELAAPPAVTSSP
ncbi:hypothetical protein [Streptomyces bluensis]|uniref:Uncharacterized protein n=1 Tax=Streptomyces bluensis TaxID=33897 RepID=A0ABW6UFR4_9ACTN